ncbi:MAG TPA: phenylalanine--tRNA ligase subunit alpha [Candidatus Aenigmarchaeota archaeon]|nr:phenylalanine--tRNA ligase subunit alpha [Candidatus Aenigmarchaeota archaeon]
METEAVLEKLHEYEKKIIKSLEKLKEATSQQISEKTGLKKDEIEKASLWAKLKGALSSREEKEEFLELSEEGKEYLKDGLPEKNLIELVNSGVDSIQELKKKYKRANIGIIWAKKNGWITIEKGKVSLTKIGKKVLSKEIEGERLLKQLSKGRTNLKEIAVSEKTIKEFLKRGLIKKIEEKKKIFFLTDLGKTIAPLIKIEAEIGQLTPAIIKSKEWKRKKLRKYDVLLPAPKIYPGKIHPYRQIIDEVREKLLSLGFVEVRGPLVELNFWNCDALFMPSDHPARSIHDIFNVKYPKHGKVLDKQLWERVRATHENGWITGSKGWGKWDFELARKLILRSHCTSLSARTLYKLKKEDLPFKMFVIDKVFRPDVIDAKHFIEFEHCEGIVVGEGLNLRNLIAYLEEIALTVGAEKIRFKPSYFPFTEPSLEGLAYYPKFGWVEFGGAGIFRPEVTLPLGIEVPVLAWGIGIGRLAMIKLKVDDIRYLYSDDLEWLRNKEVV